MSKRAWVTLATNDSYGLGALVLAHSLRRAGSVYPAVVLITPSVTQPMRDRLGAVFAEVITVDVLDSKDAAHLALLQRPELGITFTKIHCWNLTQYEKCVFLDADTLVVQNSDELFDREELSASPDVGWPDCFNSGVFVFRPSPDTFEKLIKFAQERGSFDGGDQGLLNAFFSDWAHGDINKHLPFVYNVTSAAFYSYIPALKHYGQNLKIIHFIGAAKPWLQKFNWEGGSVEAPEHLKEYLQLWWDLFVANVHAQLDVAMSGVAGNLARVVPGTAGFQREALDELSRRQGWEAGNIDYMGADSFDNIWAKISQTLSQPRSSPPKEAFSKELSPAPKQPSPPKESQPPLEKSPPKELASVPIQPLPVTEIQSPAENLVEKEPIVETVEIAQEAVPVEAPIGKEVAESVDSSSQKTVSDARLPVETPAEAAVTEPVPVVSETAVEPPVEPKAITSVETPSLPDDSSKEKLAEPSTTVQKQTLISSDSIPSETSATQEKDAELSVADISVTEPVKITTNQAAQCTTVAVVETVTSAESTQLTSAKTPASQEVGAAVQPPTPSSVPIALPAPVKVAASKEEVLPLKTEAVIPPEATVTLPTEMTAIDTPVTVEAPSENFSESPTIPAVIPATEAALLSEKASTELAIKTEVVEKTEKSNVPQTPPTTPKSTPEATTPVVESAPKSDPLEVAQNIAGETVISSNISLVSTPDPLEKAQKDPLSAVPSIKGEHKLIESPIVTPASPVSVGVPSPSIPLAEATPEKPSPAEETSTDSPPLANTPSKEEAPALPAAKSTEEAAQETRL